MLQAAVSAVAVVLAVVLAEVEMMLMLMVLLTDLEQLLRKLQLMVEAALLSQTNQGAFQIQRKVELQVVHIPYPNHHHRHPMFVAVVQAVVVAVALLMRMLLDPRVQNPPRILLQSTVQDDSLPVMLFAPTNLRLILSNERE